MEVKSLGSVLMREGAHHWNEKYIRISVVQYTLRNRLTVDT